jgi:hypothetical protein
LLDGRALCGLPLTDAQQFREVALFVVADELPARLGSCDG